MRIDIDIVNRLSRQPFLVNVHEKYRNHQRANEIASATMPILSLSLGTAHKLSGNESFWKPIILPWLNLFAVVYIDRLDKVMNCDFPKTFSECTTTSKSFWIPVSDHTDFIYACTSNDEDYKLKSQIAYFKNSRDDNGPLVENIDIPKGKSDSNSNGNFLIELMRKLKRYLKTTLSGGALALGSYFYGNKLIVLHDHELTRVDRVKLYIKSRGRVVFLQSNYVNTSQAKQVDILTRRKLLHEMLSCEKCEDDLKLFLKIVAYQLPLAYIEDFKNNLERFDTTIKAPPGIVFFSNTGIYYSESLKCALASWMGSGTKLLIQTHGFGFLGICDCESWYDTEMELADYYYPWAIHYRNKKIRPMPSICLSSTLNRFRPIKKNRTTLYDIVYVPVNWSLLQTSTFCITPLDQAICQNGQNEFIEKVSKSLKERISIRRHPAYTTSDGESVVGHRAEMDAFKDASFKSIPRNMGINEIFSSNVLVLEYFSTMFSQALVCDIPCVIYLTGCNNFPWNIEGKEFIKLLRSAKMLYADADSLIDFLNSDLVSWWNSSAVIKAKRELRTFFAPNSENYLEEWLAELSLICDSELNRIGNT